VADKTDQFCGAHGLIAQHNCAAQMKCRHHGLQLRFRGSAQIDVEQLRSEARLQLPGSQLSWQFKQRFHAQFRTQMMFSS
jgi:hypothetical protein